MVELEKTIKRGKQSFENVGLALAEIRDLRLYKSEFKTFEEYCKVKWGWSRPYCVQLIQAAAVAKSLPEGVAIATESQARELSKAAPEQREEVLQEAASDGPVTAMAIKKAVQRRQSPAPEPEETQEPARVVARDPAEALGSLKASRVITTFRTWFTMNYHNRDEWNWALDLIAEEVKNLKAQANS